MTIECLDKVGPAMAGGALFHVHTAVLFSVLKAQTHFAVGADGEGGAVFEELLEVDLRFYYRMVDQGQMLSLYGGKMFTKLLQMLAHIKRVLGKDEEARRLEGEVAEVEALVQALSQAALVELQTELREERGTTAATATKKKKLTRKQQKRKAAQRRKAEARAAAAAAVVVAQAMAEGQQQEQEQHEHEHEHEQQQQQQQQEALTAAAAQLHIHQPEPKPEPEPEPEECAICLNDLPLPGEQEEDGDGAVLLACSHSFHAECLGRWKAKCLEKGLRFTCAMCRGAVVVAAARGGEGKTEA